jgi:hypothetical protein
MGKETSTKNILLRLSSIALVTSVLLLPLFGFLGQTSSVKAAPSGVNQQWTLIIDGSVANPLTLTVNDLAVMPKSEVTGVIYCGRLFVASGTWGGVSVSYLLSQVALEPGASNLEFRAEDGYQINVAVEAAYTQGFIIAYELDGQPLNEVLRLAVSGYPGNFWIHSITRITVTKTTNYNIGPNYYTSEANHVSSSPTPKPTATPKPTPIQTPPPTQRPTATPQATQTPSPTPSDSSTVEPLPTPSLQENHTPTPDLPPLNDQQGQQKTPKPDSTSNGIYVFLGFAVVFSVAAGFLVFKRLRSFRND